MLDIYLYKTDYILLVFDSGNKNSLEFLKDFIIKNEAIILENNTKVALMRNKIDLM